MKFGGDGDKMNSCDAAKHSPTQMEEFCVIINQRFFFCPCSCLTSQELFSAGNPIVTKPKPKVELPKEEAEQNGPVSGQEKPPEEAADKGAAESTGNPTPETTDNKPDMDLD